MKSGAHDVTHKFVPKIPNKQEKKGQDFMMIDSSDHTFRGSLISSEILNKKIIQQHL